MKTAVAIMCVTLGVAGPVNAQSYPAKPVRLVSGFPAEGANDYHARVLVIPSALPAKNVKELIALAKTHPGRMNYASSGTGATPHLSAEMFKSLAKVDIAHIPYKGDTPAFVDFLAGQVDMMITVVQSTLVHIASGKLRPWE